MKLVNKIIQLIVLSTKVDLKMDKSFSATLSMNSTDYEEYIFKFVIDQYEYPSKVLNFYK